MSEAAALPASPSALRSIAEAATWESEWLQDAARSRRIAWLTAGAGALCAVLGIAAAAAMALKPVPAPGVVLVDRLTGESTMVPQLSRDTVPQLVALDQHHAVQYVRARESYFFHFLRRDYEQVARSSTPEVFAPYSERFQGEGALQEKLGSREEHRVTVISARPSATTLAGRAGEIIVTFERDVRSTQGPSPGKASFVATVMFEYRPEALKRDVDRLENPLGFVVTNYRVEAELATPTGTRP